MKSKSPGRAASRICVERRQHPRVDTLLPVTLMLGPNRGRYPATLMELSAGGAFVLADVLTSVGPHVHIALSYETEACMATGRVVRTLHYEGAQGIAIEFVHVNARFSELIVALRAGGERARRLISDIRDGTVVIG